MTATIAQPSLSQLAQLGTAILHRLVEPTLKPEDHGKFIAIAVDHEDFEIDHRDVTAVLRLLDRHPGAKIWLERAGYPTAYKIRRSA